METVNRTRIQDKWKVDRSGQRWSGSLEIVSRTTRIQDRLSVEQQEYRTDGRRTARSKVVRLFGDRQ